MYKKVVLVILMAMILMSMLYAQAELAPVSRWVVGHYRLSGVIPQPNMEVTFYYETLCDDRTPGGYFDVITDPNGRFEIPGFVRPPHTHPWIRIRCRLRGFSSNRVPNTGAYITTINPNFDPKDIDPINPPIRVHGDGGGS